MGAGLEEATRLRGWCCCDSSRSCVDLVGCCKSAAGGFGVRVRVCLPYHTFGTHCLDESLFALLGILFLCLVVRAVASETVGVGVGKGVEW